MTDLRIMARITFGHPTDAELAARELRRAGYEVLVMPDELIEDFDLSGNAAFVEAYKQTAFTTDAEIDAVFREIGAIVDLFDGFVADIGFVSDEFVPFSMSSSIVEQTRRLS
jgi:hypothetical protein